MTNSQHNTMIAQQDPAYFPSPFIRALLERDDGSAYIEVADEKQFLPPRPALFQLISHPGKTTGPQRPARPELRAKCVFQNGKSWEILGMTCSTIDHQRRDLPRVHSFVREPPSRSCDGLLRVTEAQRWRARNRAARGSETLARRPERSIILGFLVLARCAPKGS
jgi:hypothetical protein